MKNKGDCSSGSAHTKSVGILPTYKVEFNQVMKSLELTGYIKYTHNTSFKRLNLKKKLISSSVEYSF